MHPKVLKELAEVLAEPLAAVFRTSLRIESKLPRQWKAANVAPLSKKETRMTKVTTAQTHKYSM